MLVQGAIYPVGAGAGFSREAWVRLIASRPEFRRHPSRKVKNPFGGTMTVQPPADAAEVVSSGRVVGEVYWSMSEEPLVNVSLESALLHLAEQWAESMGGEFRPDA